MKISTHIRTALLLAAAGTLSTIALAAGGTDVGGMHAPSVGTETNDGFIAPAREEGGSMGSGGLIAPSGGNISGGGMIAPGGGVSDGGGRIAPAGGSSDGVGQTAPSGHEGHGKIGGTETGNGKTVGVHGVGNG